MNSTYSVAWIDCMSKGRQLGRSLVVLGEHANIKDLLKDNAKKPYDIGRKRKFITPFFFRGLYLIASLFVYLTLSIFGREDLQRVRK